MKRLFTGLAIALLVSFGSVASAKNSVSVVVFEDLNADGIQQKSEKGLKDQIIKFEHTGIDGIFDGQDHPLRPKNNDSIYTKKTLKDGKLTVIIRRGILYVSIDPANYKEVTTENRQMMRVNYDGKQESFTFGVVQHYEDTEAGKKEAAEKKKQEQEKKKKEQEAKKKAEEEEKQAKGAEKKVELKSAPEEEKEPSKKEAKACVSEISYRKCLGTNRKGFLAYAHDLACEGIIKRKEDCDGYKCTRNITKAEVTGIALKMKGVELPKNYSCQNKFSDVLPEHASWVCRAAELGHENGISWIKEGTTKFNPLIEYNRVSSIRDLMKGVCLPLLSEKELEELPAFDPELKYSFFERRVIRTAQKYGLTNRTDENFKPKRKIYRQELFVVASRLLDWAQETGGCDRKNLCDNVGK